MNITVGDMYIMGNAGDYVLKCWVNNKLRKLPAFYVRNSNLYRDIMETLITETEEVPGVLYFEYSDGTKLIVFGKYRISVSKHNLITNITY